MQSNLSGIRSDYHQEVYQRIIRLRDDRSPNFSDRSSKGSVAIASEMIRIMGFPLVQSDISEQAAGKFFEEATKAFLEEAFSQLDHIRPGSWWYSTRAKITDFEQYAHIATFAEEIRKHKELATTLGSDYIITPDIVIGREPLKLQQLNLSAESPFIQEEDRVSRLTPLLARNEKSMMMLHASVSCKWTLRSDRSQNVRTEALNLIRNRKGNTPHIAVVTAEPLPLRIASLALGTGELDCVYHFALDELQEAVKRVGNDDQAEMLELLIGGKRLRDISDLPLDLAI